MNDLSQDIFQLIQSIGLIISFLLSFITFLVSIRMTKINNGLLIAQHHRELWLEYCRNDKFYRLFEEEVDLIKSPLSFQEKQFVNMIFLHMEESLSASKKRGAYKIEGLQYDILDMLTYPIPMIVWQEYTPYYDKLFVNFVEKIIKENSLQKNIKSNNLTIDKAQGKQKDKKKTSKKKKKKRKKSKKK